MGGGRVPLVPAEEGKKRTEVLESKGGGGGGVVGVGGCVGEQGLGGGVGEGV